mgnify:CR=1 FL=1
MIPAQFLHFMCYSFAFFALIIKSCHRLPQMRLLFKLFYTIKRYNCQILRRHLIREHLMAVLATIEPIRPFDPVIKIVFEDLATFTLSFSSDFQQ